MIQVRVREKQDRPALQLWFRDPFSGTEVTRSAGTSDRLEAERAAAEWQAELNSRGRDTDLGWDEFRVRLEDEYYPSIGSRTRGQVNTSLNRFEEAVGRARRLAAIDAAVISQAAGVWRRQHMRETTIHAYLGHLRACFGWAARIGLLPRPPRFVMPRLPDRLMRGRPITLRECRVILHATRSVAGKNWRDWVRFQRGLWLSGLRLSEAIAVSWDEGPVQVDLEGGRRPLLRFRAEGHKARRDQLTPIAPDFARWLARTPDADRHGRVLPLRSARDGRLITSHKRVGRVLSQVGRAAGVVVNEDGKHASAHDFRRAFGTRWAARVRPITLKALMRHRSLETTLRYYVDQDASDVADELWESERG